MFFVLSTHYQRLITTKLATLMFLQLRWLHYGFNYSYGNFSAIIITIITLLWKWSDSSRTEICISSFFREILKQRKRERTIWFRRKKTFQFFLLQQRTNAPEGWWRKLHSTKFASSLLRCQSYKLWLTRKAIYKRSEMPSGQMEYKILTL